MELTEAKEKFIQSWGNFGTNWGINKTMAQIHALFLISDELLSTEDVMEALEISRGNTNMNIRTLVDWGLLYKESKKGERKEFFRGEKDMWLVGKKVIKVRQRQELEPVLRVLKEIQNIDDDHCDKKEAKEFKAQMKKIEHLSLSANNFLTKAANADENWFWKILMKLIK